MPVLTRWFIKLSLVYFAAALLIGVAQAAQPFLDLPAFVPALGPVYFHMFLVGWVTQLIFGVVYWMFPKFNMEKPRGSERLAWATLILLNLGLLLRVIFEPAVAVQPAAGLGWTLALSAILQWLAGLAFAMNTWGRIKER